MKIHKIFIVFLILSCIFLLPQSALATTVLQDGLEITLTSNQETYTNDDDIIGTITIKNNNDFPVNNIYLENVLPENYELIKDSKITNFVESFDSNEILSLDFTCSQKSNNSDFSTKNISINSAQNHNYLFWIILLITIILIINLIILKKLNSKSKKLLSIIFCFCAITILITSYVSANEKINITIIHSIIVNEKTIPLKVFISYDSIQNPDFENIDISVPETTSQMMDSDNDGLTNYEEKEIYKTDPDNYDTDNDGIYDGDEIRFGLNPLEPISDGITPDSERLFPQTLDTREY